MRRLLGGGAARPEMRRNGPSDRAAESLRNRRRPGEGCFSTGGSAFVIEGSLAQPQDLCTTEALSYGEKKWLGSPLFEDAR